MKDFTAAGFVNACGGLGKGGRGACANGDAGTLAGKFLRDGAPESLAGSRDDGHAACEP